MWVKQGNFQAALCIFPACWGLFPRKAALLSAGKAAVTSHGILWELFFWEGRGVVQGSPGGTEQGSLFGMSTEPTWPSRTVLPSAIPSHPSPSKVRKFIGTASFFWCRGYKFGLCFLSDKACDYASALFTGSCYLLFVC